MKPGFPTPIPFAQLQSLDRPDFVALLSTVVEHSPWVAEQTWQRRPFASWTALFLALEQTLREAEPAQQLTLLQAHPELAGREAQAGSMTSDSQSEQGRLGLLRLQPHELERLAALNQRYRLRFGIPFIAALRLHESLASVFATFEVRLGNDPSTERAIALRQVGQVMHGRLEKTVLPESPGSPHHPLVSTA
jgi:OHCU decarboxylase